MRVFHSGVKQTATELRYKLGIVRERFEARPSKAPDPPPLPCFRIEQAPPFTYTGVDLRVPSTQRMGLVKSLKRFTSRRGAPHKFISDNGKTFKATAKKIKKIMNHPEAIDYVYDPRTEWLFNIERASWWGGVFEWMVKSVKRCLRKSMGQARLTLDEPHTAIVEIEAVINSRPLSYLPPNDIEEPLTPSHLFNGRRLITFPDKLCYNYDDEDPEFNARPDMLIKRLRYLNNRIEHFWKRRSSEYLLELMEQQQRWS
ncbi:PREDICTED: uncharacterized protein LOC105312234 [Amphimedon queenslandica]|uniref:Integrase catalytic domain-containing protein n=1 Tax=Amphimedon queenslandica TaxID=400682 RepID=A0A1X7V792_AMPQE|nr:PREDICTED: uncharacterized protein LOC105312234 [Amphimedon queenslandica]|eukprot:XP_011403021.1 PREDICTED: uncharacterized protein LOC105312234 [Amphimedon queenslandica]